MPYNIEYLINLFLNYLQPLQEQRFDVAETVQACYALQVPVCFLPPEPDCFL
jgi:hypothetical protein